MTAPILVLIESPFKAATPDLERLHVLYARALVRDCYRRGEAAYASHLFYTQMLDDGHPEERAFGIEAGLLWGAHPKVEYTVVGTDFGISNGMEHGIARATREGRLIVERTLMNNCLTTSDIAIPWIHKVLEAIEERRHGV